MTDTPVTDQARLGRTACGLVDQSATRARIDLVGPDRVAFLERQCTQHVPDREPGEGAYGFVLEANGKCISDLVFVMRNDRIVLDVPSVRSERFLAWLGRYAMLSDIELVDVSTETAQLALVGPDSDAVLANASGLDIAVPSEEYAAVELELAGTTILAWRDLTTGTPGITLRLGTQHADAVTRALLDAGARSMSRDAWEVLRIEAGRPAFDGELSETVLPGETGQRERAVSPRQRCYTGQEVVQKQRALGSLRKVLVGLLVEPGARTGDTVRDGDTQLGTLGSTCWSPALGREIALAVLKGAEHAPDTRYVVTGADGESAATVTALPFVT